MSNWFACNDIGDVPDKWLHYVLVDDVACLMMCIFMWLDVFMINDCIIFLVGEFGVVINTWDGCICIMMIVITDWLCNRLCILYAWWWFMMVVDIMCCCWCCMLVNVHAFTFGGSYFSLCGISELANIRCRVGIGGEVLSMFEMECNRC